MLLKWIWLCTLLSVCLYTLSCTLHFYPCFPVSQLKHTSRTKYYVCVISGISFASYVDPSGFMHPGDNRVSKVQTLSKHVIFHSTCSYIARLSVLSITLPQKTVPKTCKKSKKIGFIECFAICNSYFPAYLSFQEQKRFKTIRKGTNAQ